MTGAKASHDVTKLPRRVYPQSFCSVKFATHPRSWVIMLGIFARSATRSIPRRAFAQTARCMSQKPPVPPKKRLEPAEKPETASASSSSAESSSSPKTEEPAELAEGPAKTGLGALDFSPVEIPHEQEKRTGARSSKDSLSTGERKRRFMSRVSLALMLAGLGTYAVYMGRDWEEDELRAKKMVRVQRIRCPS